MVISSPLSKVSSARGRSSKRKPPLAATQSEERPSGSLFSFFDDLDSR